MFWKPEKRAQLFPKLFRTVLPMLVSSSTVAFTDLISDSNQEHLFCLSLDSVLAIALPDLQV